MAKLKSCWLSLPIGSKMRAFILLLLLVMVSGASASAAGSAAGSVLLAAELAPERPQPATRDAVITAQSTALMSFFFILYSSLCVAFPFADETGNESFLNFILKSQKKNKNGKIFE